MSTISSSKFLQTLPEVVIAALPANLQNIQVRQPFRWLVQFHYGEPRLHYEVARSQRRNGWELGFHCESRDKRLNRFLLDGFRRNLFEIKDTIGDKIEAEMWDRGWTKIYEVYPDESLTMDYQRRVGQRLAEIISCLHPFYVELRGTVTAVYR
ncbi:MAG: hypothetical protein R3293_12530 [Candidatus Promineifilaceae bacterium]|nr:hypothetical protein [Candidatus Promineifilaceae bacterium]